MKQPDYIGIGAGRSGTTSLHMALLHHPGVGEVKRKEAHYWDHKYKNLSVRWYWKLFNGRVAGEITPSYFFMPGVPGRIHKHCPNVKVLVLLRNPVDAMWSSYQRMKKRSHTRAQTVLDFLDKEKNLLPLVERRHYAAHLKRWFALFDRQQFWIKQSEELFGGGDLNDLWKFLGVSKKPIHFPWKQKLNPKRMTDTERITLEQVFKPMNEELYDLLDERYDW